ncbi:MAG: hypothetical protein ACLROW_05275 [Roseburia faecis]
MVTVTECTTLGKGRLRFHLDNGTELVLYRGEAKQFRMREGSTLSDEEEHQLIYEVVGKRAKEEPCICWNRWTARSSSCGRN